MKNIKIRGILALACLLLSLPVQSWAVEVCGERVYLHAVQGGGCGPTSSSYPGTLCAGGTATLASEACLHESWLVCCDAALITLYGDDVSNSTMVTGAPIGTEAEVAQDVFTAWSSLNDYEAPAVGFSRVGTFEGFSYTSEIGSTAGTANVKVSSWKRSMFSKDGSGTITPIENIGGSGSGDVKTGVKDAINDTFGAVGAVGSPSATGTGAGDVLASDAVAGKHLSDAIDGFDTGMTTPAKDSISTKVLNFVTNHPALSIFRSAGITADATSNGACVWTYNYSGKSIDFSLDRYADKFQILGAMVLLIASIWSLFIAFGRG